MYLKIKTSKTIQLIGSYFSIFLIQSKNKSNR